jgi:hypothetical protein
MECPHRKPLKNRIEPRKKIAPVVSEVPPLSEVAKAQEQIATRVAHEAKLLFRVVGAHH